MKFVRYGGANTHNNKGGLKVERLSDYHKPPARHGIYVFPVKKTEHSIIEWKYKRDGQTRKELRRKMRSDRREIEYRGNVWHHLGASAESMGTSGSWTLDRMDVFKKKLRRRLAEEIRARQTTGVGLSGHVFEVFIPGKV